jgi:hypothetical protein
MSDSTYDDGWSLDEDKEEEEEAPLAPGAKGKGVIVHPTPSTAWAHADP